MSMHCSLFSKNHLFISYPIQKMVWSTRRSISQYSAEVNSFGEWLMPPRWPQKFIPIGAMRLFLEASCPCTVWHIFWVKPKALADVSMVACKVAIGLKPGLNIIARALKTDLVWFQKQSLFACCSHSEKRNFFLSFFSVDKSRYF